MAKIPGVKRPKWYDRDWLVELLTGIVPLITLVWAAIDSAKQGSPYKGWTLLGAGFLLLIASVLKVLRGRARDLQRMRYESPMDLLGCAHVLHKSLTHSCGADDAALRVTMHRIVTGRGDKATNDQYEQIIPYVGDSGESPGRKWSTKVGIVGRVAREGSVLWAVRESGDRSDFVKELVREWGYSKAEAKALTDDRQGWIAVPIYDDHEARSVIAVVYVDSSKKEYVCEETAELVADMCKGIATFIRTRYK